MAKISPVSIKYMIHANFTAEGALEKPDVIGALFGQTEGLLGAELEMRELQKEGKIGRIEVELERQGKRTVGEINIPTALDQSETTLIAAAIETIERIGPSEAQIEIDKIEDVRGTKRDYIIERAKKLMKTIEGSTDSREISNEIKTSTRTSQIEEYSEEKLPFGGDLDNRELIVVEGRADVVNLLKNGIRNVIGMNGTKLPNAIKDLGNKKDLILFTDGDRGGKLIIKNVTENARIKYIASAPDGKEVEELTGKEIWQSLRKKVPVSELSFSNKRRNYEKESPKREYEEKKETVRKDISKEDREKLREISKKNEGSGRAVLLDENFKEIKNVSVKSLSAILKRTRDKPFAIIIDGIATSGIIRSAEEIEVRIMVAKNFGSTDTKIELLSF
jgi:DNA primase